MRLNMARTILGVARGVTERDLKKAFKKKALQTHPDRPGGDKKTFQRVNDAYTRLMELFSDDVYDDDFDDVATPPPPPKRSRSSTNQHARQENGGRWNAGSWYRSRHPWSTYEEEEEIPRGPRRRSKSPGASPPPEPKPEPPIIGGRRLKFGGRFEVRSLVLDGLPVPIERVLQPVLVLENGCALIMIAFRSPWVSGARRLQVTLTVPGAQSVTYDRPVVQRSYKGRDISAVWFAPL